MKNQEVGYPQSSNWTTKIKEKSIIPAIYEKSNMSDIDERSTVPEIGVYLGQYKRF